ncbi:MAG: HEAT repeat domain-containing protein, partial [Planctomycetes bacterium]|nr:HEAT repeat domain-containing protein [Planctomycetota bacterium]
MRETPAVPVALIERLTTLGRAGDLKTFRAEAAELARELFGARAAALSHVETGDREKRIDALAVSGSAPRAVRADRWSDLPGRVMKKGAPMDFTAKEIPPKIAEECQGLLGRLPRALLAWPLATGPERACATPDECGPEGSLAVFDPDPRAGAALGEIVAPVLGAHLTSMLALDRSAKERKRLETLLGLSRVLVGGHPRIAELREWIVEFPRDPRPVLVQGERGTGKRHFARLLHAHGPYASRLFMEIDCSRYPKKVLHAGFFEDWFGKGPLLDQEVFLCVGDVLSLALSTQEKLAQALAPALEGAGPGRGPTGHGPKAFVVPITAREIRAEASAGIASAKLAGIFEGRVLVVPPLRDRPDDVPALADRFLREANQALGHEVRGFTHRALQVLRHEPWRGNLAELATVVTRAARLASGHQIDARELAHLLPHAAGEDRARTRGLDEGAVLALLRSPRHRNWRDGLYALEKEFLPASVPILLEKMESEEPVVRIECVRLLARHGDARTRKKILERLSGEDNRDVVCEGIRALGEAVLSGEGGSSPPPDNETARALLPFLSHEDPGIRATAIRAVACRATGDGRRGTEPPNPEPRPPSPGYAVRGIRERSSDPHPRVRAQALAALYRLGEYDAYRDLAAMLGDEDDDVRLEAVRALGEVPEAVGELLRALEDDPSIDVRIAAASALGDLRDPQAVRPLIGRLSDPLLRLSCVEALARIRTSDATGPFLALVAEEGSSLVRRAAVSALGEMGESSVAEPLREYIAVPTLAPTVLEALCKLGGPAAEETLLSLARPDHPLCLPALKGLSKVGTETSVEPLVELLGTIPDFLGLPVVEALAGIGEPAVLPLIEALEDGAKRPWAVAALGEIGDPRAAQPLMRHYDDSGRVAAAIARIGPQAIEPLLAVLPDRATEIMDLLIQFGEASIDPAVELLTRPDSAGFAEEILLYFREAAAQPLLTFAERAEDEDVLARILRILGRIGSREAFPLLLKHFVSHEANLRGAVIEGLSEVDNPLVVEGLVEAASSTSDPRGTLLALRSLGKLRAAEGFEGVQAAAKHASAPVRAAALVAAANFGGDARRKAILSALADRDDLVLAVAVRLARADGILDVHRFRERHLAPAIDVKKQILWIRALGHVRGDTAARVLLSLASESEGRGTADEDSMRRSVAGPSLVARRSRR